MTEFDDMPYLKLIHYKNGFKLIETMFQTTPYRFVLNEGNP